MPTDEIRLTYQCFSVFVRVQNLASFVKDSTLGRGRGFALSQNGWHAGVDDNIS